MTTQTKTEPRTAKAKIQAKIQAKTKAKVGKPKPKAIPTRNAAKLKEPSAQIISLKLGACLTGPTKAAVANLHDIARTLNSITNSTARMWLRWHEDHPNYVPKQKTTKNRKTGELVPKFDTAGKPVMEPRHMPSDLHRDLYTYSTRAVPPYVIGGARFKAADIAASVAGSAREELVNRLEARMPYNHDGLAKKRWEAILSNEVQLDTRSSHYIPARNASTVFGYDGSAVCGDIKRAKLMQDVAELSKTGAIVQFPVFSRKSSQKVTNYRFRLEVGKLPGHQKRLLAKIASGYIKLCDSSLTCRNGKWHFNLTYKPETKNLGLDPNNVCYIEMQSGLEKSPFKFYCHREIGSIRDRKTILVTKFPGLSDMLRHHSARVHARRRAIRDQHRAKPKGHGKRRAFRDTKELSRKYNNVVVGFSKELVADIMKFCVANNCGTIMYHEPSKVLRKKSWFVTHKVNFNWTNTLTFLQQKCNVNGIKLAVQRMSITTFNQNQKAKVKRRPTVLTPV